MKLKYRETGEGAPIILLHGWGGSSASLENLATILSNSGYKIYNIDLPGFGDSLAPKDPYSINNYVEDIKEFISSKRIDKPVIVGHSFGGKIGLFLAVKYPMLLFKLILVNSSGIKPKASLKVRLKYIFAKIGGAIFWLPPFILIRPVAKFLYYKLIVKEYDYYKSKSLRETFKKVVTEHIDGKLDRIKTNTLLIWARNDKQTPLAQGLELSRGIANSRLEIIEGTGHNLPVLYPQIVAELIIKFLN